MCLRDQVELTHRHMMEELRPLTEMKIQGYCGAIADDVQGLQTTRRFNVLATPASCNPYGFIKPCLMSSEPSYEVIQEPKIACRSPVKAKHKVTAFGPKHAAYARRIYKSSNPEFRQGLALQHRTKVSPMQVSDNSTEVRPMQVSNYRQRIVEKGDSFNSVDRTSASSGLVKSKVYVPIKSQPRETVLKVARISPRPAKMQLQTPEAAISFGYKLANIVKKSNDFHETRLKMELKDAPIFQMLCEMLRTK